MTTAVSGLIRSAYLRISIPLTPDILRAVRIRLIFSVLSIFKASNPSFANTTAYPSFERKDFITS
jgi:hypothetical protein